MRSAGWIIEPNVYLYAKVGFACSQESRFCIFGRWLLCFDYSKWQQWS